MQFDIEDAISAKEARDRAIAKHRKTALGRQYIARGRAAAHLVCRQKGSVTINDVRDMIGGPPEECSPTIMGAIFRDPSFECVGYEANDRKTCHARPIARFRLAEGQ